VCLVVSKFDLAVHSAAPKICKKFSCVKQGRGHSHNLEPYKPRGATQFGTLQTQRSQHGGSKRDRSNQCAKTLVTLNWAQVEGPGTLAKISSTANMIFIYLQILGEVQKTKSERLNRIERLTSGLSAQSNCDLSDGGEATSNQSEMQLRFYHTPVLLRLRRAPRLGRLAACTETHFRSERPTGLEPVTSRAPSKRAKKRGLVHGAMLILYYYKFKVRSKIRLSRND